MVVVVSFCSKSFTKSNTFRYSFSFFLFFYRKQPCCFFFFSFLIPDGINPTSKQNSFVCRSCCCLSPTSRCFRNTFLVLFFSFLSTPYLNNPQYLFGIFPQRVINSPFFFKVCCCSCIANVLTILELFLLYRYPFYLSKQRPIKFLRFFIPCVSR